MNTRRMLAALMGLALAHLAQAQDIETLRRQATEGNPEAQFRLGLAYNDGNQVKQDHAEALRWFQRAVKQGYADAECELGYAYEKGLGVPVDYAAALQWYRKAADQKLPRAFNNVAAIYLDGLGVPKNEAEALKWLRRAAQAGFAPSRNTLGILLAEGRGVAADPVEAYKWFYASARQGYTPARDNVEKLALRLSAADKERAQRAADAMLKGERTAQTATGTGFLITTDGYVLTCHHVVKDALRITVRLGAETLSAALVKTDEVNDLALLKVDGKFRPLPLVTSRDVRLGESVFTIGFPNVSVQGLSPKLTDGTINSLTGELDTPRFFQVSAAIQPGSSGSPLIDRRGGVVGMLARSLGTMQTAERTGGALPQNINYAIKASYALAFLESVSDVLRKLPAAPKAARRPLEELAPPAQAATVFILAE